MSDAPAPGGAGGLESPRLRRRAIDEAKRRVQLDMAQAAATRPRALRRPRYLIPITLAMFGASFALRVLVEDPGALIANTYAAPIAILAAFYGIRGGLAGAAFAFSLVFLWSEVTATHVDVLGYSTRGTLFLFVAVVVGWYAERLPRAAERGRGAEYELILRNEELERTNEYLAQSVLRFETFTEIARAVGGETELRRVLELIAERGRAVAEARGLVVLLRDGEELVVAASTEPGREGTRLPAWKSVPREVLRDGRTLMVEGETLGLGESASVISPLTFRGERFGILAVIDRTGSDGPEFDDEDVALVDAIAASAATAVATAQSIARDRLRDTMAADEEARKRWARELHDETLQGLGGLRVLLSSALRTGNADTLRDAVTDAVEQTKVEIDSLRNLITELRPAALDELGLEPALEHLAERSTDDGLSVETKFALRSEQRLAPELESTIYRVVQEALTNVAKHADAERVRVEVERTNGTVTVLVEDDGTGFDPGQPGSGLGLVGMRERIELAGGDLTIDSRPAGPTRVRATVPA